MTSHEKLILIFCLALSGFLGFIVSLYMHIEKPKPASLNDTQLIETFHYPASFVKSLKNDTQAGMKIFKEFCSSCHAVEPLIDVNAPRIGDKTAWAARKKMGMTHLLNLSIHGIAAMPARGGCFECSDEQLRETIDYILKKS
jgi:cytochrome c5